MAYTGSYGGSSHSCHSYCNISGYYSDGFACPNLFCCGSSNVRFCCGNSSLDISNVYPDKCRCSMSSCSYLSWDVLLPCIAAALFVALMVTICCCQGCRSCVKCRQLIRRRCLRSNSATVSSGGGVPADLEEGQHTAGDSTFPNLPPYEFGPPKYESLELAEAPPKYEDIMTPVQSEAHVNDAFVGDGVAPDYTVSPDYTVTRDCSVTPDCTVTVDSRSHDTIIANTSGPSQGESNSGTNPKGPVVPNSKVIASIKSARCCQPLCESPFNQSPLSHVMVPNTCTEALTCPSIQVVGQESFTLGQTRREAVDDNEEIPQVLELTSSEERTLEELV